MLTVSAVGIVYIFEGMLSVFKDNHIIAADEAPEKSAKLSTSGAGKGVYTDDLMKVEDIKNGYCTKFLVNKNDGAAAISCAPSWRATATASWSSRTMRSSTATSTLRTRARSSAMRCSTAT